MKSLSLNILTVFLLLLCFGCGKSDAEKAKIKYGITKYEKKFGDCDSANSGCASLSFEYPIIKYAVNSAVKDSISGYILETFLDTYRAKDKIGSLDEMADTLFKNFSSLQGELPDFRQSWEIQGTASVIFNNHSIVSIQTDVYSYLGGAHPNSQTYYANFNSENGRKISLADILKLDYKNELNSIAEKFFRTDSKLTPEQNLEEAGYWFVDNKFSLNENFGIKNEGLVFFFNSYEIAPYSMGPTEIKVPYSEIRNLVRQDGLLNEVIAELN